MMSISLCIMSDTGRNWLTEIVYNSLISRPNAVICGLGMRKNTCTCINNDGMDSEINSVWYTVRLGLALHHEVQPFLTAEMFLNA